MLSFNPSEIPQPRFHGYMLSLIAPRPIAFASTIDKQGNVNLSPFSFYNAFGSNPPILIFSPARSGRDNTIKNTLENIYEVPEVVINVVQYDMVEQVSLASTAYPKGVNEFVKAGFTELPSELVRPPRVKEAAAHFECKVKEVIALGDQGGAGNLVICEIVRLHIAPRLLDEQGRVRLQELDLVGRMGGDFYCRASGDSLFEVEKPITKLGIGIDQLPAHIRNSDVLTGNHLGKLANVEAIPAAEALAGIELPAGLTGSAHEKAAQLLDKGLLLGAWKVLMG